MNEKPRVAGDMLSITFCNKCDNKIGHILSCMTLIQYDFNCIIHVVQQDERRKLKPTKTSAFRMRRRGAGGSPKACKKYLRDSWNTFLDFYGLLYCVFAP